MRKMEVLIVLYYASKRAIVNGLPTLSSLTQLKTIHLEKLIVAPLQDHIHTLLNLEKWSLSLCEGLGNMSSFNYAQSSIELPLILDFNLDHWCDLEVLSVGICDMNSLQKWSIINSYLVEKLPDDLGKLIYLRMLRLLACLGLKELPASIWKLGKQLLYNEEIGQQWNDAKSFDLMELRVEVVEAHFSLDWLDGWHTT